MLRILLLASVSLLSQATPVILRAPYAPIHVQPATYVAPIVLKEAPKPYAFAYEAPAIGGSSSRQESSDGAGRVTGSYSVTDADGRIRVVDYYADETGFHANVQTNEPGTANQDSADVTVQSYAPPVVHPVASPKVVVAAAPVATSYVAPVSYNVGTLASPLTYGYRAYSPKLAYYK